MVLPKELENETPESLARCFAKDLTVKHHWLEGDNFRAMVVGSRIAATGVFVCMFRGDISPEQAFVLLDEIASQYSAFLGQM